jgi:cytochrome c oxidase subunit 1
MPRRYFDYTRLLPKHPEFSALNLLSTIGAFVTAAAFFLILYYRIESLIRGRPAPANPWGAATLEWQCASPPPHDNFPTPPEVGDPYDYTDLDYDPAVGGFVRRQPPAGGPPGPQPPGSAS